MQLCFRVFLIGAGSMIAGATMAHYSSDHPHGYLPWNPYSTPPASTLAQGGFFGFQNSCTPMDREAELQSYVGYFSRIYSSAQNFGQLCQSMGLTCRFAVDWEGHKQSCFAEGRAGSRVALCQ